MIIETLADVLLHSAGRDGDATAIQHKTGSLSYAELTAAVRRFAGGLASIGIRKYDRVAVFADKRPGTVIAAFGSVMAGGVFVPVNALLKAKQVTYILKDCDVRVLVTTRSRFNELAGALSDCGDLQAVVLMDETGPVEHKGDLKVLGWEETSSQDALLPRTIASDMAAIMYTSGSTGAPKGVVLSHLNMTIGAASVADYLDNSPRDRILSVLPFSFDAGLSQLTTGLYAGATVVLHDYLLASDIVKIVLRERITGITGVPPLWMQLADQKWPADGAPGIRYFANTGGKMPRDTLTRLRAIFPNAQPFLMYGLTEAFRSTYLPPSEVDRRPDSIGKAVPNAEVMVVAADGTPCGPGEVGELVHRGPLVSLGYWNDPERTAKRFRPAPGLPSGIPHPELAVWSGDSVKLDEDGYLYFVGRMDDMIKTSGYRVSPSEIEEVAFSTGLVSEVAALGVPHDRLGQAIVLVAKSREAGSTPTEELLESIRRQVPNYMVPASVRWTTGLPRNANGKLDRKTMTAEYAELFVGDGT